MLDEWTSALVGGVTWIDTIESVLVYDQLFLLAVMQVQDSMGVIGGG